MNDVDLMRLQGATWAEIGEALGKSPTTIRQQTIKELYEEKYGEILHN